MAYDTRKEYDEWLKEWTNSGCLEPYSEKEIGSRKGPIPLMAEMLSNKHPVVDFRESNEHIDAFTANTVVCAQKLQECRPHRT